LFLKNEHHIVRYCNPATVDHISGKITSKAFELKPKFKRGKRKPEKYLSANWIEKYSNNIIESMKKILLDFKRKRYTVKKNGRFALLNVGEIIRHVRENTQGKFNLSVKTRCNLFDKSHCGIFGYSIKNNNHIPGLILDKLKDTLPAEY